MKKTMVISLICSFSLMFSLICVLSMKSQSFRSFALYQRDTDDELIKVRSTSRMVVVGYYDYAKSTECKKSKMEIERFQVENCSENVDKAKIYSSGDKLILDDNSEYIFPCRARWYSFDSTASVFENLDEMHCRLSIGYSNELVDFDDTEFYLSAGLDEDQPLELTDYSFNSSTSGYSLDFKLTSSVNYFDNEDVTIIFKDIIYIDGMYTNTDYIQYDENGKPFVYKGLRRSDGLYVKPVYINIIGTEGDFTIFESEEIKKDNLIYAE